MILKNYLKRVMPSLSSVVFVLVWFAIAPLVRAVVPAPDGGYPGFNTAEGQNALFNLTTGVGNTAVGWFSLWSNTDGSYNTALGAGTLLFNVGDQSTGEGDQNTAIGTAALLTTRPAASTRPLERLHLSTTPKVCETRPSVVAHSLAISPALTTLLWDIMPSSATTETLPSGRDPTTVHLERLRSLTIPLAITTASSVRLHFNSTLPAKPIRPSVIVRSEAIPPAVSTRRLVFRHSSATPLVAQNTATGASALANNTTGSFNTANGASARCKHHWQPKHSQRC